MQSFALPEKLSPCQISLGLRSSKPLNSPDNRVLWKSDPRMGFYHNQEKAKSGAEKASGNKSKQFLVTYGSSASRLRSKESIRALYCIIKESMVLPAEPDDLDTPLGQLGLDSLTALENRNWFSDSLGVDISVVDIFQNSIEAFSVLAVSKLSEQTDMPDHG